MEKNDFSIFQNIDLSNKCAIITGGLGNIGIKIVETLFELNSEVIIIDFDSEKNKNTLLKLENKFGKKIDFYNTDLSKKDDILTFCNLIKDKYEKIDILIHSAALVTASNLSGWTELFENQSMEAFDLCMDINTKSALLIFQNLLNLFKKSDFAKVIFISSIYGIKGNDFSIYEDTNMQSPIAYSVSKASLNIIVKYLASLYGKDNICVNSIVLGGIFRNQNQSFVDKYEKKVPLGRMGNENDIKGLISYLSSNLSNYMTGQNIVLDGGLTCKV